MASIKISELNPATQLSSSDVLPVVSNGETKNCNLSVLRDGILPSTLLLYYLTTESTIGSLEVTQKELAGLSSFVTENSNKPIGVIIKSSSTQQISGVQMEAIFLPLNLPLSTSNTSNTVKRTSIRYNYYEEVYNNVVSLYPVNVVYSYSNNNNIVTITSIKKNSTESEATLATRNYASAVSNLKTKPGYDATKNQVLKNVKGIIQWVNE